MHEAKNTDTIVYQSIVSVVGIDDVVVISTIHIRKITKVDVATASGSITPGYSIDANWSEQQWPVD